MLFKIYAKVLNMFSPPKRKKKKKRKKKRESTKYMKLSYVRKQELYSNRFMFFI